MEEGGEDRLSGKRNLGKDNAAERPDRRRIMGILEGTKQHFNSDGDMAVRSGTDVILRRVQLFWAAQAGEDGGIVSGQYLPQRRGGFSLCTGGDKAQDLSSLSDAGKASGTGGAARTNPYPQGGPSVEAAWIRAACAVLVSSAAVACLCAAVPGYRAGL